MVKRKNENEEEKRIKKEQKWLRKVLKEQVTPKKKN